MGYKVLFDVNDSGLINVVGVGLFMPLKAHQDAVKECNSLSNMLTEVVAERDALAAQVEALRGALYDQLNDCINFDGGKLTDVIMKHSSDVLASTPKPHLAEIKAQAVMEFVEFMPQFVYGINEKIQRLANQYADQVRRGVE